jgi:hypothetical protein
MIVIHKSPPRATANPDLDARAVRLFGRNPFPRWSPIVVIDLPPAMLAQLKNLHPHADASSAEDTGAARG